MAENFKTMYTSIRESILILRQAAFTVAKESVQDKLVTLRHKYPLIKAVHVTTDGNYFMDSEGFNVRCKMTSVGLHQLANEPEVGQLQAMADQFYHDYGCEIGPVVIPSA